MARRIAESGRRGPVERFAGLKTRIGNLDETEIRFRFGRGKRGVGGGRVEKEGREGCGGRGGVAAGRQSIIGGSRDNTTVGVTAANEGNLIYASNY